MTESRDGEGTRDGSLSLGDGRIITYRTYGDPGGRAVIALHGTPGSRLKFSGTAEAARRLGLRVVAPDRWGYGGTSIHPTPTLPAFADDVARLCHHLGLDRFAVMGVSGGGPYAAGTAALLSSRVTALALVAPVGPIAGEAVPMTRFHQFCFGPLARKPTAVELVFRNFARLLRVAPRWVRACGSAAWRYVTEPRWGAANLPDRRAASRRMSSAIARSKQRLSATLRASGLRRSRHHRCRTHAIPRFAVIRCMDARLADSASRGPTMPARLCASGPQTVMGRWRQPADLPRCCRHAPPRRCPARAISGSPSTMMKCSRGSPAPCRAIHATLESEAPVSAECRAAGRDGSAPSGACWRAARGASASSF